MPKNAEKNQEVRNFGKLVVSSEGNGFCALLRNPTKKPQAFPAHWILSPDLPRRVSPAAKIDVQTERTKYFGTHPLSGASL